MMINSAVSVLALSMPGGFEWVVILVIAILIFGKRLPEVAKGLGKSLAEFKHGLKEASEIKNDVKNDVSSGSSAINTIDESKHEISTNNDVTP